MKDETEARAARRLARYELRVASYELRVASYELRWAECQSEPPRVAAVSSGMVRSHISSGTALTEGGSDRRPHRSVKRLARYSSRATSYELRATSYELRGTNVP